MMEQKHSSENKSTVQADHSVSLDYRTLETQFLRSQAILEVSRILNSTLDLDTLLSTIIEVATQILATEAASILLLDEETGDLLFEAATGAKRAEVKAVVVPLEGSIAGWIVRHNQPLVVNDAHQDARHYSQADQTTQFNTRSILGVPLQAKDKTIGVLEVLNKRGGAPFSPQDVESLEALAVQAAIAIENARLYTDLQNQMQTLQEAQTRLVQSEKLAAIGELVAGVAHELNNPLTSIMGFAYLMRRGDRQEERDHDLEKIVVQSQRAAGIVRSLLDFARQRPPERKAVQVNDVLNSTLDLLAYELRTHNVACTTHLTPDLPPTMADPYQLQQVFVNLVNNARQAMGAGGGGNLHITTELGAASYLKEKSGATEVIRITVQDDGPGIPKDVLPRIFDPFFTTKPVGEGTGLGMSVCHGIVMEHGGHIWAESEPGQGATFFIELPVLACEDTRPERPRVLTDSGAARILIIDDELDVLNVLIRALRLEGYQVDAVNNGQAALAHMARTTYDLIICDVRMPGLSGIELYQQIQRQNLARRLVFITGDTASSATRRFLNETGAPYLTKPFELTDLIEKVPALLEKSSSCCYRD